MVRTSKDGQLDPVLLLKENLNSYQLLLSLAKETHERILSDDNGDFLESIARRQQIHAEIAERDQIIEQARPELDNKLVDQRITDLVQHCSNIIAEIQKVDGETLRLAEAEREHLSEGLTRIRQGRKYLRTYGKRAPSAPRFIDRHE